MVNLVKSCEIDLFYDFYKKRNHAPATVGAHNHSLALKPPSVSRRVPYKIFLYAHTLRHASDNVFLWNLVKSTHSEQPDPAPTISSWETTTSNSSGSGPFSESSGIILGCSGCVRPASVPVVAQSQVLMTENELFSQDFTRFADIRKYDFPQKNKSLQNLVRGSN